MSELECELSCTRECDIELLMSCGFKNFGERYLVCAVTGRRTATEHDAERTLVLTAGPVETCQPAEHADLVEVMVEDNTEVLEAILAIADGGQFGDTVGQAVWMPDAFALDDLIREVARVTRSRFGRDEDRAGRHAA